MATRTLCSLFLLEEALKDDHKAKRKQSRIIRNMQIINTNKDYIDMFRLSDDLIRILENDLAPFLPIALRRNKISRRTMILCALAFFAHGSYQKSLCRNINTYVSQPTASRIIKLVVNALCDDIVVKKYIHFPQNSRERQEIKQQFFNKFKIPGVVGAIDGVFVSMVRPKQYEERFYCRKGYHARNVLVINDSALNIMHVDASFGGATHDNLIFNNSVIKSHLENLRRSGETTYLLGDSGYALRPYCMTPCSNPTPGSPEEFYNKLHSSARNTAERTYALLKGRFRCLLIHRVLHYDPDMVAKIVIACSVLHNMCNRAGLPAPALEGDLQEEEDRVLNLLRNVPSQRPLQAMEDLDAGRQTRAHLVNMLNRSRYL